ncbi:MAG: hypothetical protein AB8B92_08155 [Gammaproteobacteria bacterium]
MKKLKEVTLPKRQDLIMQKDLSAAGISLLILLVIVTLYFLYG